MKLLDINLWPKNKIQLVDFGNLELEGFIHHFEKLLVANGCDIKKVHIEWNEFKLFCFRNLSRLKRNELWQAVLTNYKDQFPNLVGQVCNILHTYPVSNAKLERGFSLIGRVKTAETD